MATTEEKPFSSGQIPPHLGVDSMSEMLEQFELRQIHRLFVDRVIVLAVASLGLITALAWDEALRDVFRKFFGDSESLPNKILYAVIITFIAVFVSIIVGRIFIRNKKRKKYDKRTF